MNDAFREYATRVSFNVSLSRNQIWVLWCLSQGRTGRGDHVDFGLHHDMFVPGAKWLGAHGLVTHYPERMREGRFTYELTEAGRHLLALVRLAGLVPAEAVNDDKKAKKQRRVA